MPFNFDAVGKRTEAFDYKYDWKEVVLYALGIGAKATELDYLYEGRGPKVFPRLLSFPRSNPLSPRSQPHRALSKRWCTARRKFAFTLRSRRRER